MSANLLRLEILDQNDKVVTTYPLTGSLTTIGQSPSADVHLVGKGIGGLHMAIKSGKQPVVMDLGGPTPLKINGKEALEQVIGEGDATVEIGSRRVRIRRAKQVLPDLRAQAWKPLVDDKANELLIRVRLYIKGVPHDVVTTQKAVNLSEDFGVSSEHRLVYAEGKTVYAQLPAEWISMKGRIQIGKDRIAQLADWAAPAQLERDTVYRVYAGSYIAEILITNGCAVIGAPKADLFPKELRKPFGISMGSVLLMFLVWMLIFGRKEEAVEEPYPVYARLQNIPIEKLPEPEPSSDRSAGGGAGSQAQENTAPQVGAPAAAAPSAVAQALTGGLKNLFGNVLSNAKSSNVVVAETGVGQAAAPAAGGANATAGKLAAVGQGTAAVAGASKLGGLAVKGSGQGFSGGSGTGLGTGHGNGIGTGVGDGIGRGGFRLVEEESIVDGGLDKSVIAAVIQNNLAQIKYCYERQLVAEPDLFGKVVAQWTINAQGAVEGASVKQTTLNSNPVEKCMLAKISGWKFPQPKNGTKVSVSYPFLFKSTK